MAEETINYAGAERKFTVVRGQQIPHVSPVDRGEQVGDFAFVDGDSLQKWNGSRWVFEP